MSERIVRFIEGGDRFVLGQISVAGRGMGMGTGFTAGGLLPAATIRAISEVPGVQGVQAQIMLPLDPSTSQFMTLTQELILGMDLSVPMPNRHYRSLPVRSGRFLREGDRRVAVVGASFAASRGLSVGSHISLEDEDYEVVGVLDRMLTAPDRFVMVSIADARAQWVARGRLLRTVLASGGMALTASDLSAGPAVGWRDGDDPDAVALRIKERVPGVNVQLPSELSRLLRSSTAFFSALLAGIGALAFVIGGLSLANTMAAAVFERIRDFGIKRALGATDLQLGREVLAESLAVTMVGGLGGIGLARGLGQEHLAERARAPGGRRRRRDLVRGHARERARPRGEEPGARPVRRLSVPVFPAASLAHGARERAPGGALRGAFTWRDAPAGDRAPSGRRRRGPDRPLSGAALGRRAAARGLLPCRPERSPAPARRRADREPRRRQRRRDPRRAPRPGARRVGGRGREPPAGSRGGCERPVSATRRRARVTVDAGLMCGARDTRRARRPPR